MPFQCWASVCDAGPTLKRLVFDGHTLPRCWLNAGPASQAMYQHWNTNGERLNKFIHTILHAQDQRCASVSGGDKILEQCRCSGSLYILDTPPPLGKLNQWRFKVVSALQTLVQLWCSIGSTSRVCCDFSIMPGGVYDMLGSVGSTLNHGNIVLKPNYISFGNKKHNLGWKYEMIQFVLQTLTLSWCSFLCYIIYFFPHYNPPLTRPHLQPYPYLWLCLLEWSRLSVGMGTKTSNTCHRFNNSPMSHI